MPNKKKDFRILLVEDNPSDVFLTREALKDISTKTDLMVASDGEEALELLRSNHGSPRPDLILLDLNLPNLNGHEFLGIVKNDADLKTIPVIVLTTSEADQDISKSYNSHANCYISKPVDLDQFSDILKTIEKFWFQTVKLPRSLENSKPLL